MNKISFVLFTIVCCSMNGIAQNNPKTIKQTIDKKENINESEVAKSSPQKTNTRNPNKQNLSNSYKFSNGINRQILNRNGQLPKPHESRHSKKQ